MHAIESQGLGKVYASLGKGRKRSLQDLNLSVRENEIYGFLGRNGAGKTTTIKILCGLLHASAGEATIFGVPWRRREARSRIGYLPEQPYFYEYLTPKETVDFYGQLQGLSKAARQAEWRTLSALLDLEKIADIRIKAFSKGMRQRIGFAVALVGDPPLLILDEPMSGLDPVGRRMIRELILQQREAGKTIFFSSHVLGDVEQICDRVGLLAEGRLVNEGRISDLVGGQRHTVEVRVRRLSDTQRAALTPKAKAHRQVEEAEVFLFADLAAANAAVAAFNGLGIELIEFTPVRESLEEYFMRHQKEYVS